jgi:hypothetical protein
LRCVENEQVSALGIAVHALAVHALAVPLLKARGHFGDEKSRRGFLARSWRPITARRIAAARHGPGNLRNQRDAASRSVLARIKAFGLQAVGDE